MTTKDRPMDNYAELDYHKPIVEIYSIEPEQAILNGSIEDPEDGGDF